MGEDINKVNDIAERIITKNGCVYEGYIINQTLGKDVVFYSLITTYADSTYKDSEYTTEFVPKEKLNEKWNWLIDNGRIEYYIENGKSGLLLHSFILNNVERNNVLIIEKGKNFVRYIDINDTNKIIKFDDIKQIEYIYDNKETSRLIDVIRFYDKNSEIKGNIVKQVIGKSIFVKDTKSNFISEYSLDDIECISKQKNNNSFKLYEQSKWIEIVELTNGIAIEGIVTSKTYGKNNTDAFIVITTPYNSYEVVKMENVVSIKRKLNREYISLPSFNINKSGTYINGIELSEIQTHVKINKNIFTINESDYKYTDIKLNNTTNKIVITRTIDKGYNEILAYKIENDSNEILTVSYTNVLNNFIFPEIEETDNMFIYRLDLSIGKYMLYIKGTNNIYLINITE